MVYVHGGGFEWGSGTTALWDGTNLAAATGAVIVTINYRLGPFGFLSNPALRAEDAAHPSAGNYAIEDQIAAFQWVKRNSAAFGGDPTNVTIFGESAGGTSILVQLASPKSQGLYTHAIVESAWGIQGAAALTMTAADQRGATIATALGCTESSTLLPCLRGKSVETILGTEGLEGVDGPVVDGFVLSADPIELFGSGTFNHVPTLLGNNMNEGTMAVTAPFGSPPTDATSYTSLAETMFPGHGAAIVAEYPISAFGGSYQAAAAEMIGDGNFVCLTRRVARASVAAGLQTFRYDFTHAVAVPGAQDLGAFHGSELMFVFGNPFMGIALVPNELPLSREMMTYWGNMAAHGDPNGGGQFVWPNYDLATEPDLVLDLTLSTETALEKARCDFWDSLLN